MPPAANNTPLARLRSAARAHKGRAVAVGAVVAVLVAAGVAVPLVLSSKTTHGASSTTSTSTQPTTKPTTKPTTTTKGQAGTTTTTTTKPGGHGGASTLQLGVDIWWKRQPTESEGSARKEAQTIVHYVTGTLHANWVMIGFPLYTSGKTGTDVFTGKATPSITDLQMLANTAKAAGLKIGLRPLLELSPTGYVWRGLLQPSNLSQFFANYFTALKPYLEMAQRDDLASFDYASEFISLTQSSSYTSYWQGLINNMHQLYSGHLIYAESTAQLGGSDADIVPGLTEFGVHSDAYFGVSGATPTTSEQTLYNEWAHVMSRLSASELHGAVLQEVGVDAQTTGFVDPATVAGPPTETSLLPMQKTWFDMICQVVRNFHLAGVYFWNVDFNLNPTKVSGTSSTLGPTVWVDRPGADAIGNCFQSLRAS